MAEPAPSSVQSPNDASGSPAIDPSSSSFLPTNADDRAAAAALSSLNTAQIENDAEDAGSAPAAGKSGGPSSADKEALGKAMSRLEMIAGGGGTGGTVKGGTAEAGKKEATTSSFAKVTEKGKSAEVVKKKPVVKVAAEDVNLLVRCRC